MSPEELGKFLRNLAVLYRSPRTGNPALSVALLRLADSVVDGNLESKKEQRQDRHHVIYNHASANSLAILDIANVERYLNDPTKKKQDLVELGVARFAIPRSKLEKMKLPDVRETVRAALLHENSLLIISQEAQRGGAKRMP